MKKESYEITSSYMKDLKKLLKNKQVSPYDIAHASFRKNNAYWIIKSVNKKDLTITYLNGDIKEFEQRKELIKRVRMANEDYKPLRRKFIARYYKIINAFTKHRAEIRGRRKSTNTIADRLTPEEIKLLAQNI